MAVEAHALLEKGDDGIAVITLNRPRALNAITFEMFRLLTGFVTELRHDRKVRAVILTGAGRAFSAGRDVKGGDQTPPMHPVDAEAFMSDTISLLEALPQPVIAAVNGACYTGGLELVVAADIIIASESAAFCDTHAKLGIVPGWGMSTRLPRWVGYSQAKIMSFTCKPYTAREAAAIGLVDRVVPDSVLLAEAKKLGAEIAANSAESVAKQKKMLNFARSTTDRDSLAALSPSSFLGGGLHPGVARDRKKRSDALFGEGGGPGWEPGSQNARAKL